jgi:hypothetical protein
MKFGVITTVLWLICAIAMVVASLLGRKDLAHLMMIPLLTMPLVWTYLFLREKDNARTFEPSDLEIGRAYELIDLRTCDPCLCGLLKPLTFMDEKGDFKKYPPIWVRLGVKLKPTYRYMVVRTTGDTGSPVMLCPLPEGYISDSGSGHKVVAMRKPK